MTHLLRTLVALLIVSVFVVGLPSSGFAATINQDKSAPVQLTVQGTSLQVDGVAAPGALITFFDVSGTPIGSTTADASGNFSHTLFALTPGLQTLKIQQQDADGFVSEQISDVVNLAANTTTVASYLLPPTLQIDNGSTAQGTDVQIRGSGPPGAVVSFTVDGIPVAQTITIGADGRYGFNLPSGTYGIGSHILAASLTFGAQTSFSGTTLQFNLTAPLPDVAQPLPPALGGDGTDQEGTPPGIPTIISPQDGVITTTSQLRIDGLADPFSQIEIYVGGVLIGSTFADQDGRWTFLASTVSDGQSSITAVACREELCSEGSQAIGVEFTKGLGTCSQSEFTLAQYRFFGIRVGQPLELQVDMLLSLVPTEEDHFLVVWGDDSEERFDVRGEGEVAITHAYEQVGQYNGRVVLKHHDCAFERYFSVEVTDETGSFLTRERVITLLTGFGVGIGAMFITQSSGIIRSRRASHRN